MFYCALLCVHSSFAIISIGKRELVALLCLASCCQLIVVWLFLTIPRVCLQSVIVVFPDHKLKGESVEIVKKKNLPGMTIDDQLKFEEHITNR